MNSLRSSFALQMVMAAMLGALLFNSDWVYWGLSNSLFEAGRQSFLSKNYQIAEFLWIIVRERDKSRISNPDSSIEYWNTQVWLGKLSMEQGRFTESEVQIKDALRISKNINSPGYYLVPRTMRLLSSLYERQNKLEEAVKLRNEADRLELAHQSSQTVKTR